MNTNKNFKTVILLTVTFYLISIYFLGNFGRYLLYPVSLLTTYFHELGHATTALLTFGSVKSLDVNLDTSGVTLASSASTFFLASGGYLGSIVFGNLLLYFTIRYRSYSGVIMMILIGVMLITSIFWFADIVSTIIIITLAILLFAFGKYLGNYETLVIMSICVILSILKDYETGPSGDQAMIASITMIPVIVWRFVWLGIAFLLSYKTMNRIFRM